VFGTKQDTTKEKPENSQKKCSDTTGITDSAGVGLLFVLIHLIEVRLWEFVSQHFTPLLKRLADRFIDDYKS
jgi:hypothetical protein